MRKIDIQDLINTDFPDMQKITEDVKRQTEKESTFYRGGVRISSGRFFTDQEVAKKRKLVLTLPIP